MPSKSKKITIPKLKKKAYKIWSEIVRKRGFCELCGKKYKQIRENGKPVILNAHHIIGRENLKLSWNILNGISLCSYCHKFSKIGPHKGGIIFSDWYQKKYPNNYKYLLETYSQSIELTIEYMEKIIKDLNHEMDNNSILSNEEVK